MFVSLSLSGSCCVITGDYFTLDDFWDGLGSVGRTFGSFMANIIFLRDGRRKPGAAVKVFALLASPFLAFFLSFFLLLSRIGFCRSCSCLTYTCSHGSDS